MWRAGVGKTWVLLLPLFLAATEAKHDTAAEMTYAVRTRSSSDKARQAGIVERCRTMSREAVSCGLKGKDLREENDRRQSRRFSGIEAQKTIFRQKSVRRDCGVSAAPPWY